MSSTTVLPSPNRATSLAKEKQRIKILRQYAVLDSDPEQEFDDLAAMAAHICGTPIAMISLVDSDRQWFKAKLGNDAIETPRAHSFCAHAINRPNDVFVVHDAAEDPRFAHNPLVTGDPGIRFYAGAPLVTRENAALGTICVIDRVPRILSDSQKWMLQTLSSQVVATLERRLANLKRVNLLPVGINNFDLEQLQAFICANRSGWALWQRLLSFLARPILDQHFASAYLKGAFLSNPGNPGELEVTLVPSGTFDAGHLSVYQEYFKIGMDRIRDMHSLDLHFWADGMPDYLRTAHKIPRVHPPWTNAAGEPVKVVRVDLHNPHIIAQFRKTMNPFDQAKRSFDGDEDAD